MIATEREKKIEHYGQAYAELVEGLKQFPLEMWQFRPAPDGWTIHEHICHITDSEANSYVRCRRFIAEPGSQVMAYDENRWTKVLDYHERSPEEALELFKWLRQVSYNLIKTLPEPAWSNTVYHSENGAMTMDDWLDTYDDHAQGHLRQMREIYAAWQAQQ